MDGFKNMNTAYIETKGGFRANWLKNLSTVSTVSTVHLFTESSQKSCEQNHIFLCTKKRHFLSGFPH